MKWLLIALLAFAMSVPTWADDAIAVHKKWGIKYASGGMTAEQKTAMQELAPKFPIHLFFYVKGSKTPIRGVKVTARDVLGEVVLQAEAEGPMFLIDADDGRYTIEAEYNGEKLSETKDLVGRRYLVLQYEFHAGS